MGISNKRHGRAVRAAIVSGLLSTAGLVMLGQPASAQSDPSDPSDTPTTTTTTFASTTTTSSSVGAGGLANAGGFANTGGNSELLLVGGLGLGAAAVAARRYAGRA